MARHYQDSFSSPTTALLDDSGSPDTQAQMNAHGGAPATLADHSPELQVLPATMAQIGQRALVWVSVLAGLGLGTLLMLSLAGPPSARLQQDAELANLVRGMVAIKGLILLAALSLVSWRLGRPVARPTLIAYAVGLGSSAAALAWMWSLNAIPIAALLFYAGLIGCFYTASRDRKLLR
jgi:hypothetical protein